MGPALGPMSTSGVAFDRPLSVALAQRHQPGTLCVETGPTLSDVPSRPQSRVIVSASSPPAPWQVRSQSHATIEPPADAPRASPSDDDSPGQDSFLRHSPRRVKTSGSDAANIPSTVDGFSLSLPLSPSEVPVVPTVAPLRGDDVLLATLAPLKQEVPSQSHPPDLWLDPSSPGLPRSSLLTKQLPGQQTFSPFSCSTSQSSHSHFASSIPFAPSPWPSHPPSDELSRIAIHPDDHRAMQGSVEPAGAPTSQPQQPIQSGSSYGDELWAMRMSRRRFERPKTASVNLDSFPLSLPSGGTGCMDEQQPARTGSQQPWQHSALSNTGQGSSADIQPPREPQPCPPSRFQSEQHGLADDSSSFAGQLHTPFNPATALQAGPSSSPLDDHLWLPELPSAEDGWLCADIPESMELDPPM